MNKWMNEEIEYLKRSNKLSLLIDGNIISTEKFNWIYKLFSKVIRELSTKKKKTLKEIAFILNIKMLRINLKKDLQDIYTKTYKIFSEIKEI